MKYYEGCEEITREKTRDFQAKMKLGYDFKKAYAARRAWEFYNHPEVAGRCYVAVGGLDSITLFLFLRSIGIDVPATSVSMLEDRSIQRVHKALGVKGLLPVINQKTKRPYNKVEVIREYGFLVLSKEIAGKIYTLQHPTEKNATLRHAIMTGETGAYGGYRKGTRMKMAQKWLEIYGGTYTGSGSKMSDPLHTVTAVDHNAMTATHLVKMKGTNLGGPMSEPVQTITAGGGHFGVVTTTVVKAEPGADLKHWPEIRDLLNTYCGYRLGPEDVILFEIGGTAYFMADIGLRMLTPRELYMANGFPVDYKIERDYTGTVYPKTKQVARCGNAVPPPFATALVRANLPEWCSQEISTMEELEKAVAV